MAKNRDIMTRNLPTIGELFKCMSISCHVILLQKVCSGEKWSYYDKKLTHDRSVVEMYVHFLSYYSCTIGV